MDYPCLQLKKNQDRRLQSGHLWIYSNEVDTSQTPLKNFTPGQLIFVRNAQGKCLGTAYINPNCLLCARLLSREAEIIDEAFFSKRIQAALKLRQTHYQAPYYRLIFGESDGLPGLIVDRYGDTIVLQCNTAGMNTLQPTIIAALEKCLVPERIIVRNDGSHRLLEGLELYQTVVKGDGQQPLIVEENSAVYHVPLLNSQKTGWFYDHRDNRSAISRLSKNKTVLDVFSYLGGWSIPAAMAGATHVTSIDSSALAIDNLLANATLNQVAHKISPICQDAFKALACLKEEGKQFDIIIVDPPAFIKSKKDKPVGLHAYKKLNRLALQLLAPEGILVSASCSMHLHSEDLLQVVQYASQKTQTMLSIIGQWHQSADHPVHPMIPETHYLKALACQKRE